MMAENLPPAQQAAAVRSFLGEGKTLQWIGNRHPDLAQGIELVSKEQERPPKARRSGPIAPQSSFVDVSR